MKQDWEYVVAIIKNKILQDRDTFERNGYAPKGHSRALMLIEETIKEIRCEEKAKSITDEEFQRFVKDSYEDDATYLEGIASIGEDNTNGNA